MYDYDRTKVWNSSRGKGQHWRNGRKKSSTSRKQEVVPDGESYQGRRGLEKAMVVWVVMSLRVSAEAKWQKQKRGPGQEAHMRQVTIFYHLP